MYLDILQWVFKVAIIALGCVPPIGIMVACRHKAPAKLINILTYVFVALFVVVMITTFLLHQEMVSSFKGIIDATHEAAPKLPRN